MLLNRWRSRAHRMGEQWTTWRREWEVERDLERVLEGTQPIIVGPWLSEVGYEVLYWIPFLRWVMAAYRIPEHRLIAMSRGGTESWYRGIASRYVEVFDYATPVELSARVAAGVLKQREVSDFDRHLTEQASHALGFGDGVSVLHPSLMFRWFAPFWSGARDAWIRRTTHTPRPHRTTGSRSSLAVASRVCGDQVLRCTRASG